MKKGNIFGKCAQIAFTKAVAKEMNVNVKDITLIESHNEVSEETGTTWYVVRFEVRTKYFGHFQATADTTIINPDKVGVCNVKIERVLAQ